jgi:DNA processing protein
VAIVGSRSCTPEAQSFVRQMAAQLGRAGVTIVSGGAVGIDAAAHRGALDAGTPTLVVAPAGLSYPFPAEHAELFHRVVDAGGAYLSLDPGMSARGRFFPRNAVLAALSDAVVVGEANARSGSRNAAKHARSLGRALFAVPAAGWNAKGWGSNAELRLGARWVERTQDVLRYLIETGRLVSDRALRKDVADHSVAHLSKLPRTTPHEAAPKKKTKKKVDAAAAQLHFGDARSLAASSELTRVRQALVDGHFTPDAICEETGLSAQEVQIALFELTLRGEAQLDAGGVLRLLFR